MSNNHEIPVFTSSGDYSDWLCRMGLYYVINFDNFDQSIRVRFSDGYEVKTDPFGHILSVINDPDEVKTKAAAVDDTSDLDIRFSYHKPKDGQPDKYVQIRNEAKAFAETLKKLVPFSPELDHAIDKIDEAVMWANAGVARRE